MSKKQKVLSRVRKQQGYTQASLAEALNVDAQTVRSWEWGAHEPGIGKQKELADLLGVPWEELNDALQSSDPGPGTDEIGAPEQGKQPVQLEGDMRIARPRDKNRQRMIQRVQSRWISGVLDQVAPGNASLMHLNLQLVPDAVASPWLAQNQEPYHVGGQPPLNMLIHDAYEQAGGELLILGEPGAGKTTLLLEVAGTLLGQCRADETFPIPVIFNLSAWAVKKAPFADWLIEELNVTYQVPVKLAQRWVANDQICPLLDGLDEVTVSARPACVSAINVYRQEHGLIPIVICCRSGDYQALPERLIVNMAVEIQPLTPEQIDDVTHQRNLEAMRRALQTNLELQEIVSTPLMLNILSLNTQGMSPEEIQTLDRSLIFENYIDRLLRKEADHRYPSGQMKKWLSWLALQMQKHNQVEFYLEQMQPDLLYDDHHYHHYRRAVIRIVMIIQCLITGALTAWLKGGLKNGVVGSGNGVLGLFGGGSGNTMLGWMAPGIGGGTQGGASLIIILIIVVWVVTILVGNPSLPNLSFSAIRYGLFRGLRTGLMLGIAVSALAIPFFSHVNLVHGWQGNGILYGLGLGFFLGISGGLMNGLDAGLRYKRNEPQDTVSFWDKVVDGLVLGAGGAVSFMVVEELLGVSQQSTLIYSGVIFLFYFIAYGFGGGSSLFSALIYTSPSWIRPAERVTWSWANMALDVRKNSARSLVLAIVTGLSVSIVIACMSSFFFFDIPYGLHYGAVFGIICGVIIGVAGWLTGMITSGWSSDMIPQDQHVRPNEGILHSGRNALLGALVFAPLGAFASGIACGIGFGMVGGLGTWPVMAKAFAVMFVLLFFVVFATAQGGIAWIQHYVLRVYLWRNHTIPFDYVRFLNVASDYAILQRVGGGYMFTHRLVMDHFAHQYNAKRRHT
ncbi:helix-turn-helix domain-containing protein [Dictyobacter formicarum]|uniref:HTH cro/C1-type domain-containing protein n=1 Tax=Dictyobacter formicarum TaxID=2778368 RepID=A0ABQ3VRC7_9CHLR|nr:helix-turn-helix domain-containing protein [Dictyobacter formicarum]GHO88148.1 hypothetical protein KSZ_61540 [Dictyobacter formicarum]